MDETLNNLEELAQEAFSQVVEEYSLWVDATIESLDAFSDLGFSDWDIVDTGRLLESKAVNSQDNEVEFEWSPRDPETGLFYAPRVWAGFLAYGRKYIPGRHWPERAAQTLNDKGVTATFVDLLKAQGLDAEIIINGDEDLDS
jgi:hypothetical protein